MRIRKIAPVVVAAVLLTAGCGSDGDGDNGNNNSQNSAGSGSQQQEQKPESKPLAVELTQAQAEVVQDNDDLETPQPEPDSSSEFTEKVEHRLRKDLLRAAKVNGKTTADCPAGVTLKASAASTCTASYEGVEIPFTVKIADDYGAGDFLIRYDAQQEKDLLVAKRVYQEFWERHEDSGGYEQKLTCDEIPAVKAVEKGADTGYKCQVWHEAGNRTTTFSVVMDTFGYSFTPVDN
ncbi:hypothetical protein ACFW40_12870 [Streptomyces sp. NPDC058807]|uniref:hypothetical protein n=1 Tax=unclassified Streptomyces TaxID=2593676 RepID=UPI00367E176A